MNFLQKTVTPTLGWHLLGWTLFTIYVFWGGTDDWESNWILGADILAHIATFYVLFLTVYPRTQRLGNSWLVLAAIPVGILGFIGFRYFFQELLLPLFIGFGNYETDDLGFYFQDNLIRGLYIVIASLVSFLILNLQRGKVRRKQLEMEKARAELAFLRSQINPHFLFNTLSYLHTEAFMVDNKLAGNILRLADILRYATQNTKLEKRTIAEEVELLHNYIEIFRQRFEGRCYLNFKVEGANMGQRVEPLLLMPFVENAFKHGHYVDPGRPIEVALTVAEGELTFRCLNAIKLQQKDEASGIGLENVRRRLALLYPGQHELLVNPEEEYFTVCLSLQL